MVTFESGSKLSRVGMIVFWMCPSLAVISIPPALRTLFGRYESVLHLRLT
jgi:hypothetical protein